MQRRQAKKIDVIVQQCKGKQKSHIEDVQVTLYRGMGNKIGSKDKGETTQNIQKIIIKK